MRHLAILLALTAALPGCATITTDDHQSIAIRSDPQGATCSVHQGGMMITTVPQTPATVLVPKGRHDIAVDCSLPGYHAGAAVLEPHFQNMTYANVANGLFIGLLVDASTGAIMEYPRGVIVLLDRQPLPGENPAETARLAGITELHRNQLRSQAAN